MSAANRVQLKLESSQNGEMMIQHFRGEMYNKGTSIYIRYREAETQAGETQTTVKLSNQEIKIIRHGQVESEQIFIPNHQAHGMYRTAQGTFKLLTYTRRIRLALSDGYGTAEWSYELHIGDQHAGKFNLKLTIQEEKQ